MAFKLFAVTVILSSVILRTVKSNGHHAHSFQHFHGPVIGENQEVTWKDKHGHHHHDYVAHPHYEFSYGVEDHHTGDYHGQKEHRDAFNCAAGPIKKKIERGRIEEETKKIKKKKIKKRKKRRKEKRNKKRKRKRNSRAERKAELMVGYVLSRED
ncbi:uncharacterized protein LOC124956786 isoform X1 [Vespa velutina]|uniref:uncharacterized protein LOC124956786 isoform X1 n=1 Tax=Vespa velutina TaxID=202808 RepID=UPI001FB41C60|nr:uncharacterized protein LOC124956786 isoform X1 [Vespa velutina]XP_047368992.1 uncharacterized protein LOC124956786 isoform X1 [Vespa velutina]